ncbi:hypothetical protein ACQUQU_09490 [Thalassolituus sp. LLYu03]|uniref:hypothetical protein n=1 Tax=Thalassolituus sp. LLYu03 TaxID=3421656 RepID=UPI003D292272
MELTSRELRETIIRPTLVYLGKYSDAAENILAAIARLHHQNPRATNSEALYPIDAYLHQKVWDQHLAFAPDLASRIRGLASQREFLNNPHSELTTNLCYATAIAWSVYLAYPQVRTRTINAAPAKA